MNNCVQYTESWCQIICHLCKGFLCHLLDVFTFKTATSPLLVPPACETMQPFPLRLKLSMRYIKREVFAMIDLFFRFWIQFLYAYSPPVGRNATIILKVRGDFLQLTENQLFSVLWPCFCSVSPQQHPLFSPRHNITQTETSAQFLQENTVWLSSSTYTMLFSPSNTPISHLVVLQCIEHCHVPDDLRTRVHFLKRDKQSILLILWREKVTKLEWNGFFFKKTLIFKNIWFNFYKRRSNFLRQPGTVVWSIYKEEEIIHLLGTIFCLRLIPIWCTTMMMYVGLA